MNVSLVFWICICVSSIRVAILSVSIILFMSSQFLMILSEDGIETSSVSRDQELALSKAVDVMVMSLDSAVSSEATKEKQEEYERDCREKTNTVKAVPPIPEVVDASAESIQLTDSKMSSGREESLNESGCSRDERSKVGGMSISYQRKMTILFELISACLADIPEDDKKQSPVRKGYDARHRVALRLLATWLDVKWNKVV